MKRIVSRSGRLITVIAQDEWATSPRDHREYDTVGTIVSHSRCPFAVDEVVDPSTWTPPAGSVVLPIYAYVHSGIVISTDRSICALDPQGWDSGKAGYIYADPETISQNFAVTATAEDVKHVLRAEIEDYNMYLQGDVWCNTLYYVPYGADPNTVELSECEELDGQCEIFGYDYAVSLAEEIIEEHEEKMPPLMVQGCLV